MKEGQNLSYVTRIGAYGFAVVAAFAVALAVLLSAASTAEAVAPEQGASTVSFDSGIDGAQQIRPPADNVDTVNDPEIRSTASFVHVRREQTPRRSDLGVVHGRERG